LLLVVGIAALLFGIHAGGLGELVRFANMGTAGDGILPLAQRGLQYGVAGAFAYVLIEFGRRAFRDDLTIGTAKWAIVTLVVGPSLAVIVAIAWKAGGDATPWQSGAVLFFAGFAPRRVAELIQTAAIQLLKANAHTSGARRLIPLATITGISAEIEERLGEEGIHDASSLASADPVRLIRDLPYDARQVLVWMDQALLITTLPKHREALDEAGISGGIDLAWRWLLSRVDGSSVQIGHDRRLESWSALAVETKEQQLLHDAARQLFYDEQLRLVWVLYNCFCTRGVSG
jgi:hypothetical protein